MTTLADTVIGVAAFAVAGLVGRDRPDANRGSGATGGTRIGVRRSTRPPERLVLGVFGKRVISAEPRQSVIVFGPSQSRKTSGFAVPAILGWEGPVIATSIKADLVGDTMAYRLSLIHI